MTLTLQEKLALAMTSAGSQRALAELVGVSHQRIGRWLREGEPAVIDPTTGYQIKSPGAKAIPQEFAANIDFAFKLHKQIARDQAKADNIPFTPETPVFSYRPTMRNGKKGAMVFVKGTEFIQRELRADVLTNLKETNDFLQATVRSTVDFWRYSQRFASEEISRTGRRIPVDKLAKHVFDAMLGRSPTLAPTNDRLPISTPKRDFRPQASTARAVADIQNRLKQKHETSAIHLADMFSLQLLPLKVANEKPQSRKSPGPRKAKAKGTRVRTRRP